jgi:Protein of unknown function, DUF481
MTTVIKHTLLFLVLISHASMSAQVINIERQRIITDTAGWSGDANIAFNAIKFNKTFMSFDFNNHLQFKTKSNLFLLYSNLSMINADGEKFNNSGFFHFRYNRTIVGKMKLESFFQMQINKLLKVNYRELLGLGLRCKMTESNHFKLYLGTTYMYETEKLSTNVNNYDHRSSNYVSFSIFANDNFTFRNTIYFQPLYTKIADHRFSTDTQLCFKITKRLNFTVNYYFMYDTKPADETVSKASYNFVNALTYNFGK